MKARLKFVSILLNPFNLALPSNPNLTVSLTITFKITNLALYTLSSENMKTREVDLVFPELWSVTANQC